MMTVRNKTSLIAVHCSKILTWNVSPNSHDNLPYHVWKWLLEPLVLFRNKTFKILNFGTFPIHYMKTSSTVKRKMARNYPTDMS